VDFEVHEPPELVEHVRAVARRLERAARSRWPRERSVSRLRRA
jgi:hypothetical protein